MTIPTLKSNNKESVISHINLALDANRKRDAFERDMDNFLFGGPPVRTR